MMTSFDAPADEDVAARAGSRGRRSRSNAAGERLARALGVFPVAAHHARARDADLADLALGERASRSSRRRVRRRGCRARGTAAPHETRRTAFSSSSGDGLARALVPERRRRRRSSVFMPFAELGERDRERRLGHAVRRKERLLAGSRRCANASAKASSVSGRIGSAPQPATRQRREIEPFELALAGCASRRARRRSSGANAMVPLWRVIAWNQRDRPLQEEERRQERRSGCGGRAARARSR